MCCKQLITDTEMAEADVLAGPIRETICCNPWSVNHPNGLLHVNRLIWTAVIGKATLPAPLRCESLLNGTKIHLGLPLARSRMRNSQKSHV